MVDWLGNGNDSMGGFGGGFHDPNELFDDPTRPTDPIQPTGPMGPTGPSPTSFGGLAGLTSGEDIASALGYGGYGQYFTPLREGSQAMATEEYWEPYRQKRMGFLQGQFGRGLGSLRAGYERGMRGIEYQQAGSGFAGSGYGQRAQGMLGQQIGQQYQGLLGSLEQGRFGVGQDVLGRTQQAQSMLDQWYQSQLQMALSLMGAGAAGEEEYGTGPPGEPPVLPGPGSQPEETSLLGTGGAPYKGLPPGAWERMTPEQRAAYLQYGGGG